MANNNAIFNAALAGASGGVQAERQISDSSAASYAGIRTEIVAFATAIDTAIATTTISDADAELMQSICQAVTERRFLAGQTPANLLVLANAVAAFWTELRGSALPVPPSSRNLAQVYYVDPSIAVSGDGNIENPFKTIQEAVDAAVADTGFATIYLSPGDYLNAAINTTGFIGSIIGLTGLFGVTNVGVITANSALYLENIESQKGINWTSVVYLHNVEIVGNLTGQNLHAFSDIAEGQLTVTGTITLTSNATLDNYLTHAMSCAGLNARNCSLGALTSSADMLIEDCDVSDITIAANVTAELFDCTIEPASTFTGGDAATSIFALDSTTYRFFLNTVTTLTTAHLDIVSAAARDTLAFVVAGISAGGTAYFTAAIPATSVLFGLNTDDPIAVNPTADLAAAGANAGFLASARVSALNTVRICLRGNIADATYNFVVTKL